MCQLRNKCEAQTLATPEIYVLQFQLQKGNWPDSFSLKYRIPGKGLLDSVALDVYY